MQPVLERGSIDKHLTFEVGLIQLSLIPVCSPTVYNTCNKEGGEGEEGEGEGGYEKEGEVNKNSTLSFHQ